MLSDTAFDVKVQESILQDINNKCESITRCTYTERVLEALNYYESMNINNPTHQQKIVKYFKENNNSFVDDYIHGNDLEIIDSECHFMECQMVQRHYRDRRHQITKIEIDNNNLFVEFYRELMDGIHCYLYHLYDVGLRVRFDDVEEKSENDLVDSTFIQISNVIKEKKKMLNKLDGFDRYRYESNKFNISVISQNISIENSDNYEEQGKLTFTDALFQYMQKKAIDEKMIKQIESVLCIEEYDSDSISDDVIGIYSESNIAKILKDESSYCCMQFYAKQMKISELSFSIGYIFYYWDFYKFRQQFNVCEDNQMHLNQNDHSGYQPYELYVEIKYQCIKDEILHNNTYTLN
eukprot:358099_1